MMMLASLFLLIPTLELISFAGFDSALWSRYLTEMWDADCWALPFITSDVTAIVLQAGIYLAVVVSAYAYWQGYQQLQKQEFVEVSDGVLLRWVFGGGVCLAVVLALVIPFHSQDILGYINRGVQQVFYYANPYLTTISQLPAWESDPLLHRHWIHNPCPYGFVFAQLAKFLTQLGQGQFALMFFIFKGWNVLVHLATMAAIYQLSKCFNKNEPASKILLPVYLYGWNPLILLNLVANGHNDGLLALLVLLSVLLVARKQYVWVLPILMMSILVKYVSLVLMPLYCLWLLRRKRYLDLLLGLCLCALVTLAFGWPYLQDWQHLPLDKMADNAGKAQHSLQSMMARIVFYGFGLLKAVGLANGDSKALLEQARQLLKPVFNAGYLVFFVVILKKLWQDYTVQVEQVKKEFSDEKASEIQQLLKRIVQVMLVLLVIASAKFHVWYLGMVLPLAFLLPTTSLWFMVALYLSLFQLFSFTFLENIHIISGVILILTPLWLAYKKGACKKSLAIKN
jgi:hypothetical protein